MVRLSSILSIFKDDDDEGVTPLGVSLIENDIKSVEILLESEVDVNRKFKYLGEAGIEWISPLAYSIGRNDKKIVDVLIRYGAKE